MDGAMREASGDDLHAEMRGVTRVYPGGIHALAATDLRLRRGEFLRWSGRPAAASRRCSR